MSRPPLSATMGLPLASRPRERRDALWLRTAALLAFSVTVGILLYYAQFSGSMRWLLALAFISAIALFGCVLLVRRSAEPAPLVGPIAPGAVVEGDLGALAATVKRASRGLVYSQVLVASRARAAFVERVRLALGLSPEAMRDAQRDSARLRQILHDEVLEGFVHMRVGDLEERYRWVAEARERGGFDREFRAVLARMEAWR